MLIGISGKIGSGKTTLATMIIKKLKHFYNIEAHEKSFASKLKEICSIISGLPIEDMYSHEGKNKMVPSFGMTVGQLQQNIGTEVMRDSFDTNVWVKALLNSYINDQVWLITDVRFENEAEAILDIKSHMLIRLEGDPVGVNMASTRDKLHASETSLDEFKKFTHVIYNNEDDIEYLNQISGEIVREIEEKLCKQKESL